MTRIASYIELELRQGLNNARNELRSSELAIVRLAGDPQVDDEDRRAKLEADSRIALAREGLNGGTVIPRLSRAVIAYARAYVESHEPSDHGSMGAYNAALRELLLCVLTTSELERLRELGGMP